MKSRTVLAILSFTFVIAGLGSFSAFASSHREAPGITRLPQVDGTDFYLFRSYESGREGFVTLIANYNPLQDPYGGPNYFPLDADAVYEIHPGFPFWPWHGHRDTPPLRRIPRLFALNPAHHLRR